ncbi:MAG: hypothetical protein R3E11_10185 [Sphingobium sp.]|nr:hypothetical protein [Sphingobium sp.]MCP5399734.1 hypothetical protein [Sphingomonas sp.]
MNRARISAVAVAAMLGAAMPAGAVGLGPLSKEGLIDGPRKGFELVLYNPYDDAVDFIAYAVGIGDETPQQRVTVIPQQTKLGGGQSRRLIVIARDLSLNEHYQFRVCAERQAPPSGIRINARVCSKLSVTRVR